MEFYLFIVTVGSLDEGKHIARTLVKENIAACVNVVPNIFSIFKWKDKIEEENEQLLLIKTTEDKSDLLVKKIEEIHSYENPECIGFKINKGTPRYLKWIHDVLQIK